MACQAVTNGFKCGKGTVTIGATDPNITIHSWMVDGNNEGTAAQFQKTYNTAGIHSIIHGGINSCGGVCAQTTQLEIVDVSPPPPAQASSAPKGVSPLVVGAVVVALGILGIVMLKKK